MLALKLQQQQPGWAAGPSSSPTKNPLLVSSAVFTCQPGMDRSFPEQGTTTFISAITWTRRGALVSRGHLSLKVSFPYVGEYLYSITFHLWLSGCLLFK